MKLKTYLLALAMVAFGLTAAPVLANDTRGSELSVWGAAGEFENERHTEHYRVEVRHSFMEVAGVEVFGSARGEYNDHPVDELERHAFVGGGFYWKDWRVELVGNEKRFRSSILFIAPTETWDIRGGVIHGNKWEKGFKQTGLHVSVGYPIGEHFTVGAFYDIQNTTMRSVDDLYGGFLRANF
tara:strand:+ start:2882 stop:3430 length:549 start_codon:yes stop_codon:yes gene_type:complete